MKNLFVLLMIAFLSVSLVACNEDEPQAQPETITEIAAADPQFSTLVGALVRTGLDDVLNNAGTFTVFAPTNDAFTALGVDLSALSDADLTNILLYHVLGSEVTSSQIAEGQTYVNTLSASGPSSTNLSLLVEKSTSVKLNNNGTVIAADIAATNGVIHVIDKVLLPLDIVGHAQANNNFTELVGALSAADLVSALQGEGPFTVFAPLNSAFAEISETVDGLTTEQLANVLKYHVVTPGNILSGQLTNGQVVTALNTSTFTVNIDGSVTITDANQGVSTVALVDVQATNGVIHVLTKVLLP